MFCLPQTWPFRSKLSTQRRGTQSSGPAVGQAVPVRPGVVAQESVVANEVNNPACVNNRVLSATSDSGIYVTGIVNHTVTCILLNHLRLRMPYHCLGQMMC